MNPMIIYLMFGGISFFVFFLFVYMINRDKVVEEKFAGIEMALENVFAELDSLKKELKDQKSQNSIKEVQIMIETIAESIKGLENKYQHKFAKLENKLNSIEFNVKEASIPKFMNSISADNQKIRELYKQGYSIEEISRELRIPIGEVELALKFP